MIYGKKFELINIVKKDKASDPPHFLRYSFSTPAVVHLLPANTAATFDEYDDQVFFPYYGPYIINQLPTCKELI